MTQTLQLMDKDKHEPRWQFATAQEALYWSVEVLRRRRLPKLAAAWRVLGEGLTEPDGLNDVEAQARLDAELVGPARLGWLPQQGADRYALALSVLGEVYRMSQRRGHNGALLLEYAWGDWITDARLQRAVRFQEVMRRQGVRVLINYRYTFRQLAELHAHGLGGDGKAMWRRVQRALTELEQRLLAKGLLVLPDTSPPATPARLQKDVRALKQGLTTATT